MLYILSIQSTVNVSPEAFKATNTTLIDFISHLDVFTLTYCVLIVAESARIQLNIHVTFSITVQTLGLELLLCSFITLQTLGLEPLLCSVLKSMLC